MIDVLRTGSLLLATLTTGLMAGLFFAYTFSVMPGLARADDRTFTETMQRINVAIVNGWFLFCFLGALAFTLLAAALQLAPERGGVLLWVVAAAVLYAAVLVITGRVNVPLNNQLATAGPVDQIADVAAVRTAFEATWVRWNAIRTAANIAAFGCLIWALVLHGRVAS
ncbi:MAG: DUF1772 domain-containing protein [Micromonosporaceae bacterium]